MNFKFETTVYVEDCPTDEQRTALLDYLIGQMSFPETKEWMESSKYSGVIRRCTVDLCAEPTE